MNNFRKTWHLFIKGSKDENDNTNYDAQANDSTNHT